ncbi:MAG: DUF3466 family protein [Thermoguttaceae bacterium]|jgi:probable HAF family extracellular repeat protein
MRRSIVLLSALFFVSASQYAWAAVLYTLTDLGTFGGTRSDAYGINNSGQVVGWAATSGDAAMQPFLHSGSGPLNLATDDLSVTTPYGYGVGLNSSGQVVGQFSNAGGAYDAFVYSGGSMHDLGTFGGAGSYANGINDSGQIVGCATTGGGDGHAFLHSGTGPLNATTDDLGTFGGTSSEADGINKSGQVVGWALTRSDAAQHAFLYSGGTMHDLGTFGGTYSEAQGINNSGEVVGFAYLDGIAYHAFLHSGSGPLNFATDNLGTLGGRSSYAYGINSGGQVVGWADTAGNVEHAFIYNGGTMQDLNSLMAVDSGFTLEEARGIDDSGEIVGYGTNSSGQEHAFLLTPTPEPSTLALLGAGAIGLLAYMWRRRRQLRWPLFHNISITALALSVGVALSSATTRGQDIYVGTNAGTIGEYTTSGGTVNASLITGLSGPESIAVTPAVPEPATPALLGSALLGLGVVHLRRRGAKA